MVSAKRKFKSINARGDTFSRFAVYIFFHMRLSICKPRRLECRMDWCVVSLFSVKAACLNAAS